MPQTVAHNIEIVTPTKLLEDRCKKPKYHHAEENGLPRCPSQRFNTRNKVRASKELLRKTNRARFYQEQHGAVGLRQREGSWEIVY